MLTIQDQNGVILAYLNNLEQAKIHEVLNGEYILGFVAIIDPLKTDYLYDKENYICYNNDLFKVVQFEEFHDEDNMLTVSVLCEHISYSLITNELVTFDYTDKPGEEVMSLCLLGTGFTLRACNVRGLNSIHYEETNSKEMSIAIASIWGGELGYYRNYIDLYQQRGADRGVDFRFGKNIKSVKRIVNFAEDTIAYEIDVVIGSEFEELGYFELGDTVRAIDDALKMDYQVRIIDLEKDVLTGINSKVILGNEIKDLRSSFTKIKKDLSETKKIVADSATDWNKLRDFIGNIGEIIIGKQNSITGVASMIKNMTGTFEHRDNGLYWQDQPTMENSTFATLWGAGGIVFANTKDVNGEWVWKSALNAEGLIATEVVASALYGMTVQALIIIGADIVGGAIKGVTIEGSTIYAGDRLNGNYTTVDALGRIIGFYNGKRTFELYHAAEGRLDLGVDLDTYGTDFISITPVAQASSSTSTYYGAKISVGAGSDLIISAGNIVIDGTLVQLGGV